MNDLLGVEQGERHNCAQHSIRDPGFSLVAIQERFTATPGWYREGEVRDLVLAYYFVLRTAMRSRRDLRRCLARCRHCRIFFVAHARNGGREDLGCPFGCREAYRKKRSAERSAAYYRTAAGKVKKARLNSRRRERSGGDPLVGAQRPAAAVTPAAESDAIEFDAAIVEHVRVVVSLIERCEVSREEVVAMLERTVRQRRIVRERRLDYVLRWLAEHPP